MVLDKLASVIDSRKTIIKAIHLEKKKNLSLAEDQSSKANCISMYQQEVAIHKSNIYIYLFIYIYIHTY